MTGARAGAAVAAIATALLLQGALIVPLAGSVPVSLPAVVVAAVALTEGPGVGIAFGFGAGLLADLASTHPAGVLALCWLAAGLVAGLLGAPLCDARSVRSDAALAALAAALAGLAATGLLALVHAGVAGGFGPVLVRAVPATVGNALLALAVVPASRRLARRRSPVPPPGSAPMPTPMPEMLEGAVR